jgi:hypothetical protein
MELSNEISVGAERLGVSISDYIVHLLSLTLAKDKKPKHGAELVEYWRREGLIGSRPEVTDSQEYARQLRARAEKRTFV